MMPATPPLTAHSLWARTATEGGDDNVKQRSVRYRNGAALMDPAFHELAVVPSDIPTEQDGKGVHLF